MKMEPDIIINPQQIADSFNNIFTNIATVLTKDFPTFLEDSYIPLKNYVYSKFLNKF